MNPFKGSFLFLKFEYKFNKDYDLFVAFLIDLIA